MNKCHYGNCLKEVTDSNSRTGKIYHYCLEHRNKRNNRNMELYYNSKGAHNERQKKSLRNLREEFIKMYGGQCECCGETTYEFLTLDHVQGDGGEYRRPKNGKLRNSYGAYRDAVKIIDKSKYQILCMNCNFAKGKYGKCPHNLNKEVIFSVYENNRDG